MKNIVFTISLFIISSSLYAVDTKSICENVKPIEITPQTSSCNNNIENERLAKLIQKLDTVNNEIPPTVGGQLKRGPLMVAHKGAWSDLLYPQNTSEAVSYALDNGFRGIEIDVRFSKDGIPFLSHDNRVVSSQCDAHISKTNSTDLIKDCIIDRSDQYMYGVVTKEVKNPTSITALKTIFEKQLKDHRLEFLWLDLKDKKIPESFLKMLKELPSELTKKIMLNNSSIENLANFKLKIPGVRTSLEGPLGGEAVRNPQKYVELYSKNIIDAVGINIGTAVGQEKLNLKNLIIGRKKRLKAKLEKLLPRFNQAKIPIIFWTLKDDEKDLKNWLGTLYPNYLLVDSVCPPQINYH